MTLEQNPPERKFLTYIKIFSQEDFALKSKLRPAKFSLHHPSFAGNSRSTDIPQLQAGKTLSKRARSHFSFVPLCITAFSPFMAHHNISLRFRAGGQRVKNFSFFHEFACPHANYFCQAAADSILMPPTFPIASLNRYTPNFSGVPQKLTWCQQFGLQIFPK